MSEGVGLDDSTERGSSSWSVSDLGARWLDFVVRGFLGAASVAPVAHVSELGAEVSQWGASYLPVAAFILLPLRGIFF